ncbi:hypothetical protein BCR32DRAFT_307229 [Anaeromyces robustus]|uniref:MULE transposase domain-containing protein n=1 Tax=Anaeromyces robustus TaxID=1754192 RepID=A0A1Y1VRE8_9FUNG|nr:hypothetical protein BCR32DRAFT_307229 [Anaeromyces robustus]|eukprot:ORX63847.1 hypothetical protein BCR32DRAFT_307229 [Anaeromyces robustus]
MYDSEMDGGAFRKFVFRKLVFRKSAFRKKWRIIINKPQNIDIIAYTPHQEISKNLPPDLKSFDEIPDVSEYYKTKEDKEFKIFKNDNLIIFQSPFQAELFSKYEDIFADGTFYTAPAIAQQVFITRTYIEKLNSFYTTSFSIIKNKEQINYEILLEELKKNANKYNSNNEITPKYFNCDFEKAISNAAEKVFPNINIKYCIWHYKRAFKNKFNKLCSKEYWNYYNNIKHITNNASESYNNQLKSIFSKKPTFFKLIYVLQKQEFLFNIDYQRRIAGYWEKKPKKLIRTDEINLNITKLWKSWKKEKMKLIEIK